MKAKNLYSLSKDFNEKLSSVYSNFNNLNLIGLRFFTAYGELGRPDMMMMKYIVICFRGEYLSWILDSYLFVLTDIRSVYRGDISTDHNNDFQQIRFFLMYCNQFCALDRSYRPYEVAGTP